MAIRDLIPWTRSRDLASHRTFGSPLDLMAREMDRLFGHYWSDWSLEPFSGTPVAGRVFSPQIDVSESDSEVTVRAELPGLGLKDIDLSLSDGMLSLKGEKKVEHEEKGDLYYRSECSYGSFERDIRLPADVDGDKVNAVFDRGVLTITLPKTPEAAEHRRKIEVKSSS